MLYIFDQIIQIKIIRYSDIKNQECISFNKREAEILNVGPHQCMSLPSCVSLSNQLGNSSKNLNFLAKFFLVYIPSMKESRGKNTSFFTAAWKNEIKRKSCQNSLTGNKKLEEGWILNISNGLMALQSWSGHSWLIKIVCIYLQHSSQTKNK